MPASGPPEIEPKERVPLPELRDLITIGEPLPFRVLDAQARLLLNEGQVVTGEPQWQMLIERGAWAELPAVAAARAALAARTASAPAAPAVREPSRSLFDGWEQRTWQLDALLRQVVKGAPVAEGLRQFADQQLLWIDHDPDVALFMAVRRDDRRFALYALTHGQHTATVAVLAARQLGWDLARQHTVLRAALTMNISILDLQATLAEQREPPSQRQLAQIRAHPEQSRALLAASGVTDEAWLGTVADHHEQQGGGGYPRQLAQVNAEAELLRAADVFMAKISPRAQRPALSPQVAARQLFQQTGGGALASALVKAIGLYPPGDLVLLKSGEVAVVTRRAGPTTPKVAALSDARGHPVAQTTPRDTADPGFAVTGPLVDRSAFARVLPERVYGLIEFSPPSA